MSQKLFDMLQERGFVKDMTHPEQIKNLLNGDKKITFYLGIDPTADSLHIGHFFALRMFRHLQNAGHRGILVIGGATSLVGDPTGKSDMRKMLTKEQVQHNLEEVKQLASHFVLPGTEIVNNADWMNKFTYVDFMRLVCVHFNVNTMLASEAYARRRENGGLTFLEMGYMPMQAYDFVHLYNDKGCVLEIGGSDQWGNIVAGTELFRKMNLKGQIGIALDMIPKIPATDKPEDIKTAQVANAVMQDYFYDAIVKGKYPELALEWYKKKFASQ